jgi:low affinity Fe/Cu permease
MVFLIQNAQNKDSRAVHLKLNELIAAHEGASNRIINIEDLSEKELEQIHNFYVELSQLAKKEDELGCTHTYDAASINQGSKSEKTRTKYNLPKKEHDKSQKSNGAATART